MPAAPGSRLAGLPVLAVRAPDGTIRHVVALRLTGTQPAAERVHRVVRGEGIDLIARRELGDEGLWWRVLDANPVRYPLDLPAGEVLRLPAPEQATRANRARSF
jgi:hypothetical protein